ncbi:MAG: sulfurtransferase [Legionellales bacterium RIFCSPHIGHO2_12_FULL_35_11]|nr:MAG: sulfurtransferase [Legionellales bacterium RIFCSPHIGHO2_12_FULL_35_11]
MLQFGQFIQNHWQFSLAFVIISFLIFINEYLTLQKQAKSISSEQAIDMMNNQNAVIIDLREPGLYKSGHIIDSIRASEADFKSGKLDKYKNSPIILVCTRGIQAAAVAKDIRTKDFKNPMVLRGGLDAWKEDKLPLVKK